MRSGPLTEAEIWMTAPAMSPMTSACAGLGLTMRISRQNAGAERAHGEGRKCLADRHVEDEAGCQQDGEQHEVADVKPAALGGGYGAGLGEVVLRHGDQPFLLMEEGR